MNALDLIDILSRLDPETEVICYQQDGSISTVGSVMPGTFRPYSHGIGVWGAFYPEEELTELKRKVGHKRAIALRAF